MPLEVRLLIGLALSTVLVYATTPLAIRIASRLDFYDKPRGYRGHAKPTPFLGGAAVVSGFVAVVLLLTREPNQTLPVLGGVVVLWAVGTIDDRRNVPPLQRVVVEAALATILWSAGLGWSLGLSDAADLVATVVWVVAVVNAFNLFDNMDGASSTMGLVVAGAISVLGLVQSDVWLAVTAAALCGACLGFLPHNLSRPSARIFLGDGGSMPIGFAVAALVMIGASAAAAQWQALVMGLLLVGVPALDTCLVVVSRKRRGISILTGGRDHLTHRTQERMRTAHGVAAALGGAQALLSALALVAVTGGSALLVPAVLLYLVLLATVIVVLDSSPKLEVATVSAAAGPGEGAGARRDLPRLPASVSGLPLLLLPFGLALGLSPFWRGFYDASIWVPAGLGVLLVLTACVIARPVRLTRLAVISLSGIAALALWALASALWTDSIEGAVVESNRLLLYAAGLGLLVVLLRNDRVAAWLYAAVAAGALAVAGWVIFGLLAGDNTLFLAGRLHEPLEYVNGQASFFLLALWPCLALAEQKRSPLAAGIGLGAATLFASLVVIGQSRGAILAAVVSLLFVVALLPGRLRRAAGLMVLSAGLLPAMPALLDVYTATGPDPRASAGRAMLICGVVTGVLWGMAVAGERRAAGRQIGERLRQAAAVGIGLLALSGAVAGIASADRAAGFVDRQYHAFVTLGGPQGEATASRLSTGAGNRYDYWRIAEHAWRSRPLVGVGAGGYDKPYFRERATTEDIRQPHSLPLQLLAELGVVGALLLLTLLVAVGVGVWRRIAYLHSARLRSPIVVASFGVLTAWFVHTSVDWIHLLPGITGIALIATAVLLRPGDENAAEAPTRLTLQLPRLARIGPAVAVGLAIAIAALSLSRQGLSEHYVNRAQNALADDPASALDEANRALRLDREAVSAYYAKAAAIARFGDGATAEAVLLEAARREPENFVTWTLLGDLAVRREEPALAERYYRRAAELNPRDAELATLVAQPG